jgi:hypothetical protein
LRADRPVAFRADRLFPDLAGDFLADRRDFFAIYNLPAVGTADIIYVGYSHGVDSPSTLSRDPHD